jgi:hypothetical protein
VVIVSARFCFFDGTALDAAPGDFAVCAHGHLYGADFLATMNAVEPGAANMAMEDAVMEAYGWVGPPDSDVGLGPETGWYEWRHVEGADANVWRWFPAGNVPEGAEASLMFQFWGSR